jgi:acetyl/propionyl-CoA carboxylase alpha subunit
MMEEKNRIKNNANTNTNTNANTNVNVNVNTNANINISTKTKINTNTNTNANTKIKIKSLAIINRGEVAVRIIQACEELGIETVLLHSEADRGTRAYRMADRTLCLGPAPVEESYLHVDRVIKALVASGVDAVHPGFGFLSENAFFVEEVEKLPLIFVGPDSASMKQLGNKIQCKKRAQELGIPLIPGYQSQENQDLEKDLQKGLQKDLEKNSEKHWEKLSKKNLEEDLKGNLKKNLEEDPDKPSKEDSDCEISFLVKKSREIGYPVLVKAALGGGGWGMKLIQKESEALSCLESAKREAFLAFGSSEIFLEKYLDRAKHIEIQMFVDSGGEVLHFYDRDCSVQRRHQKIIEEGLSSQVTPLLRQSMIDCATRLVGSTSYRGAATVEFLVQDNEFYLLEVNTRLQVEHPVTEMIMGVDLVKAQILTAAGEYYKNQESIGLPRGHGIECRIYAENPFQGGFPSTGVLELLHWPQGPGRRFDYGFEVGDEITPYYDAMLAKVIVWDETRPRALLKMQKVLKQSLVVGVHTNIPYLLKILEHPEFIKGTYTTQLLSQEIVLPVDSSMVEEMPSQRRVTEGGDQKEDQKEDCNPSRKVNTSFPNPFEKDWMLQDHLNVVFSSEEAEKTLSSRRYQTFSSQSIWKGQNVQKIHKTQNVQNRNQSLVQNQRQNENQNRSPLLKNTIVSPMPGQITKVLVSEGETVIKGQTLIMMEAMKMEYVIKAETSALVKEVCVKESERVKLGQILVRL